MLSGSTANLASATTRTFTATIEDAAGNTVTSGPDAGDNISFAQTAGAGSVTGLSTVAANNGIATDTITGKLAGSVTLAANATVNGTATSSNTQAFTVTFGTATQIVLSGSTANLASATTRTFTATIEDAAGNTVTSGPDAGDNISFAQTAGAGSVTGLSTVAANNGDRDRHDHRQARRPRHAGSQRDRQRQRNQLSNTLSFSVVAGTPTSIALVSGSGQSAAGNTAFTSPLEALVTDTNGNPVSGAR